MQVLIKRCRLRITRHGGWSWGLNRHKLADRAARRFCAWILQQMTHRFDAAAESVVDSTVRIHLSLNRRELIECLEDEEIGPACRFSDLQRRIDEAIVQSGIADLITRSTAERSTDSSHLESRPQSRDFHDESTGHQVEAFRNDHPSHDETAIVTAIQIPEIFSTLLSFLQGLEQAEKLPSFLARLDSSVLSRWHDALLHEVGIAAVKSPPGPLLAHRTPGNSHVGGSSVSVSSRLAGDRLTRLQMIARMAKRTAERRHRLIGRIQVLCAATDGGLKMTPTEISSLLDELVPLPPSTQSLSVASKTKTDESPSNQIGHVSPVTIADGLERFEKQPSNRHDSAPRSNAPSQLAVHPEAAHSFRPKSLRASFAGELACDSALPFLILQPLFQCGYLDLLGLSLSAAKCGELTAAFAACLALKVTDMPERDWRHLPSSMTLACAMAGGLQKLPTEEIHRLDERADQFCSGLDTLLGDSLLGHETQPRVLHIMPVSRESFDGYLISDCRGHFPIALLNSFEQLEQLLLPHQASTLLVLSPALSSSEWLENCESSGFCFLSGVPSGRGRSWRPIAGRRGVRLWTNDRQSSSPKLLHAARLAQNAEEAGDLFWNSFAIQRQAVPLASGFRLEKTLSLAAGAALAQLALDLWGECEETDPTLAVERLGDLACRIRFRESRIEVILPLGRRSDALRQARYLEDIPGLPWLQNRSIVFSRG